MVKTLLTAHACMPGQWASTGSMCPFTQVRKEVSTIAQQARWHALTLMEQPSMAGGWPLDDFMEFGALPTAAACARLRAKQLMWEWGLALLSDCVELIVSELVTNAIRISQSMVNKPPIGLWLRSDKSNVLILVRDASPQPPMRIAPDIHAEAGRGLTLVESLSDRWDWYPLTEMGGKVVWALCVK